MSTIKEELMNFLETIWPSIAQKHGYQVSNRDMAMVYFNDWVQGKVEYYE